MKFIDKLERKHPRWGIENLMLHVSILNLAVFGVYIFRNSFVALLYLERSAILSGQVWRLLSFIAIPPTFSPFFLLFVVYLYYSLGTTLERNWGTFRFTAFYAINIIGTIIAAFLTGGYYGGYYVNLSIFLAFAYLLPNYEFLLFFFLPVKVKYLAYLDLAYLAFSVVLNIMFGDWAGVFAIVASLSGLIVFFGGDIIRDIKAYFRRKKYMRKLK